ncbi:unnamed protein product [Brachionus calyciflorus]|uniref:CCHC-type domain-containing protein n=1 Tax=Brachionus calyciflorus TaxID=104777 RepID=A0A814S0N6_9BILA|nr:unnamed protein product [Brachionus calyciflorus]
MLNHRETECKNATRCLKCADYGHSLSECKNSKIKCIYCEGTHFTSNENCQKVCEKTYSLNENCMEILLGEGLIENKYNVKKKLKDTTEKVNQNLNYENRVVLDDEKINNLVETAVKNKIEDLEKKFHILETNLEKQKVEIIGLKDGLKSLENVVENVKNEVKKELDSVKVDVNSVKEDLNREA